jgi:hypothetical protein
VLIHFLESDGELPTPRALTRRHVEAYMAHLIDTRSALTANEGFVDEVRADAAVRSCDEDDGSVECGHALLLSWCGCAPPGR